MSQIFAVNLTGGPVNAFVLGPDFGMATLTGLPQNQNVTFTVPPYQQFVLGAFSSITGLLVYLQEALPNGTIYWIIQNQPMAKLKAAQKVLSHNTATAYGAPPTGEQKWNAPVMGRDDKQFSITVKEGHGTTEQKVNIGFPVILTNGYIKITSPPQGTWHIRAVDTVQNKVVFDQANLVANQEYPFNDYQTADSIDLVVTADWSIPQDINLTGILHYDVVLIPV